MMEYEFKVIIETRDVEPKEMFKYKMTNEIRDIVSKEILNMIKSLINSLLEKGYVGKLREKTPVDRKEQLLIVVEPRDNKNLIHAGIIDENNEFKIYGKLIEELILENGMLIYCSFGRDYNMLTLIC